MRHDWTCDNCGAPFRSYCFGPDVGGTIYETPPLPSQPLNKDATSSEIMAARTLMKMSRHVTFLCDKCIQQ
jgi:hypothetical protein